MNTEHNIILEGTISIEAVMRAGSREITRILIDRDRKPTAPVLRLRHMAAERGIPVCEAGAQEISSYLRGKTSGGVIAFAAERRYEDIYALLHRRNGLYACLEGFEDPFNYGYAIRALYAAGIEGIFTSRSHWNAADGIYIKASAGASEAMPISRFDDYEALAKALRDYGFQLVCAAQSKRALSLYEARFRQPAMIVVGGEKRGISKVLLRNADLHVQIPYARAYPFALPGVAAAAVIGFELMRQRIESKP